jgi:hypothetical protein
MKTKREKLELLSKEELINKYIELEKIYHISSCYTEKLFKHSEEHEKRLEGMKLERGIPDYYSHKWNWVSKLIYILKQKNVPLTSSELLGFLLELDEEARYWSSPQKSISSHLSKAVKYERILGYKVNGIQGYYYVLPEWMEKNNELKEEYRKQLNSFVRRTDNSYFNRD